MISFALVLPTLVLASSARVESLSALSTGRNTYEPRTEIRALFSNEKNEDAEITAEANLVLKTKLPAVNLINFDPIRSVQCTGDTLAIDFDNLQGAKDALSAWAPFADKGNLAMIAAPQHGCGGTKMGFMIVKNLSLESQVMKATQTALEPAVVVNEYSLDVAHTVPKSRRRKRVKGVPYSQFPLNLNFDGKSVIVRNKTMYDSATESASCINCHMKGHTTFKISVGGSLDKIHSLKFGLEGELTANLELNLKVKTSITRDLHAIELFKLSLNPIDIGGIIEVGPKLALSAGISMKAGITNEVDLNFGSMIEYPFKFGMINDNGFSKNSRPNFDYIGAPKFVPTPVKFKGRQVALVASIGPKIALSFKLFGVGVEFALKFGTNLSLEAISPGCNSVPIDTSLYTKTSFEAEISAFQLKVSNEIWGTKRTLLPCEFCNKCAKRK